MWSTWLNHKPRSHQSSLHDNWCQCHTIHAPRIHFGPCLLSDWLHVLWNWAECWRLCDFNSCKDNRILLRQRLRASWLDSNRDNYCHFQHNLRKNYHTNRKTWYIWIDFPKPVYRLELCHSDAYCPNCVPYWQLFWHRQGIHIQSFHCGARLLWNDCVVQ